MAGILPNGCKQKFAKDINIGDVEARAKKYLEKTPGLSEEEALMKAANFKLTKLLKERSDIVDIATNHPMAKEFKRATKAPVLEVWAVDILHRKAS